jgi:hypothetical protein
VSGACKVAGRGISAVASVPLKGIKASADLVGKVPLVGKPLSMVVNLQGAPFAITQSLIAGERIDKIALKNFNDQVAAAKAGLPIAKMVVSVVPGVGSGVGAALAVGEALANGQSIDKVFLAAAKGAVPGGAIAAALVDVAVSAVQGKNILDASVEAAINQLPAGAKEITAIAKGVVKGQNIKDAATETVIKALPENLQGPAKVVQAAASGANIPNAVLAEAKAKLPASVQKQVSTINEQITFAKNVIKGKGVQAALEGLNPDVRKSIGVVQQALSGKVIDKKLLDEAYGKIPKEMMTALQTGGAVAHAYKLQKTRKTAIKQPDTMESLKAKMIPIGRVQIAKNKIYNAGYGIVKSNTQKNGFLVGIGLMSHSQLTPDVVMKLRNSLSKDEQIGFDAALALKIGTVTSKRPAKGKGRKNMSPKALAAFYQTKGLALADQSQRVAVVETLTKDVETREAAKEAIGQIQQDRTFWAQIKEFLGL